MPITLKLDYWAHSEGVQAPVTITVCKSHPRESMRYRADSETDGKAIAVEIDVPLDSSQEEALKALMQVLESESGSNAMMAIENLIETAFLSGVEFLKRPMP